MPTEKRNQTPSPTKEGKSKDDNHQGSRGTSPGGNQKQGQQKNK